MKHEFSSSDIFLAYQELKAHRDLNRLNFIEDMHYVASAVLRKKGQRPPKHSLMSEYDKLRRMRSREVGSSRSPIRRGKDGTYAVEIEERQVRHSIPPEEKAEVIETLRKMDHIEPEWLGPAGAPHVVQRAAPMKASEILGPEATKEMEEE